MPSLLRRAVACLALGTLALGLGVGAATADTVVPDEPTAEQDPAATASDGDLVSFGIAPAGPDGIDTRPYLKYTAAPGTVIYDHVAILNQDDEAVDLDVYARDVVSGESGSLAVPDRGVSATRVGSWITTDASQVQVPAQTAEAGAGSAVVRFALAVPANAEPGEHVGAIVASLTTRGQATGGAPALDLEQRVAARVYVTVDGDLAPGLVVRDLGALYERGGLFGAGAVVASYVLENTGNTRMKVTPTIRVDGPLGRFSRGGDGPVVDELLPGGRVQQEVRVEEVWPVVRLAVTVTARADIPASGGVDPGLDPVVAHTVLWAVPWVPLGILVLLLGLVAWWFVRRRRRRRAAPPAPGSRRAGRSSGPAPAGDGRRPAPVSAR